MIYAIAILAYAFAFWTGYRFGLEAAKARYDLTLEQLRKEG
jgi:hypothetical protein